VDEDVLRIVRYIVWRAGCIHPFRISRILVLAGWKALERLGRPPARIPVEGFEAGFYIPGLKEAIEADKCLRINEEKRCIEYVCEPPSLDEELRSLVDQVVEETRSLGDQELNRLVIRDPRYRRLLEKGGLA
jgi:hydroxypyruvate isomerase